MVRDLVLEVLVSMLVMCGWMVFLADGSCDGLFAVKRCELEIDIPPVISVLVGHYLLFM